MKKKFSILGLILSISVLFSSFTFCFADDLLLGDVNGNGRIEALDALLALQYSVGRITLDADDAIRADFDRDGKVTVIDALGILQIQRPIRYPFSN